MLSKPRSTVRQALQKSLQETSRNPGPGKTTLDFELFGYGRSFRNCVVLFEDRLEQPGALGAMSAASES